MRPAPPRVELTPPARAIALGLTLVGAAAAIAGAFAAPHQLWAQWLLVSYYALTLGLGGLCFVAIHYATGSTWSVAIRRVPEALAAIIPVAAIAVGVVLVARPQLYPWTSGHLGAAPEAQLAFKRAWLAWPFFLIRAAGYAVLWTVFAWAIRRQSRLQDTGGEPGRTSANRRLSLAFLVLFAISFSLASFDWVMSLEPEWYSTIFGVYHFAGLFLAALAAVVLLTIWLERLGPLAGVVNDEHLHDLGKLLFAFSTFWAYIWFSQYMLVWYANLPEETVYFVARMHGAWFVLFVLNIVLNWAVPFVLLLRRDAKRNRRVLASAAIVVLVGRWLDLYLMILPPVVGETPRIGLEIGLPALTAGLLAFGVARALRSAPAVPIGDPELAESLHYEQ